jgi:hypothetical protein
MHWCPLRNTTDSTPTQCDNGSPSIPVAAGSRPQASVSGPDGAVWFGTLTKVCKVGSDRKISESPLPDNLKRPRGAPRATIV